VASLSSYNEKDAVRGNDSMDTFEEVSSCAFLWEVDKTVSLQQSLGTILLLHRIKVHGILV
jgi:hypothetical protein